MKDKLSESILVNIKEANSELEPVDIMCQFIGELFNNMTEGFETYLESLYDWCEGGDAFRNAGYSEDVCKELDSLLMEVTPLVDEVIKALLKHTKRNMKEDVVLGTDASFTNEAGVKKYLETVCNFLNNTKGQIEEYEVKFLLKWLCESNDISYDDSIPEGSVEELSGMVEDDAEDEFVATIFKYLEEYRSKDSEN